MKPRRISLLVALAGAPVSLLPSLARETPSTQLALTASVVPDPAPPGAQLTFLLTVTNTGDEAAGFTVGDCPVRYRIDGRFSPRWSCGEATHPVHLGPGQDTRFDADVFPGLRFDPHAFPLEPGLHRVILAVEGIGGAETEFTVEEAAPEMAYVAGRVLLADGNPVPDGTVALTPLMDAAGVSETGDAAAAGGAAVSDQGYFLVGGVEPGEYLLRATTSAGVLWYPGVADPLEAARLVLAGGEYRGGVELTYAPADTEPGYILAGRVSERARFLPGHPLEGAAVLAVPEAGEPHTATTGPDGRFRMEVPQGRYRLVAGKLVKNRYRYWDGRSALPGADSFPVPEAGSDPSRFRIELAPLGNAPVAVLSGRVFAFDPRSSRPPRPLTGARVEAIPLLPSQNASAAPIREETDEDGTFVIEVPPDTPYLLRAEAEGFEPRFHRQARRREDGAWIDVEPGGRRPRLDVTLMPRTREDAAAAVEGSVLRRLSEQECAERKRATCLAPVAGVEVRMAPAFPTAAPVVHRTRTGTDGRFRFEGLLSGPAPGGDYYLSVVPGNDEPVYYPEGVPFAHALPLRTLPGKTVDAGRILAAESPPAAGWLEGTVTDEEKRPLEGALVRVRGPGAETARTARTGQDGAFVVRGLPEGEPVRISAEADGYVPGYYPGVYRWTAAEPVIVPDAGSPTSPVHLTLRPSGSAGALLQSGRVLTGASPEASPMDDAMDTPEDPAGRPLRGAFLYAFNAGGPVSSVPVAGAVSAENGAAILTGLAEGTYFLMADCPGFEAAYFTRESPDHPSPVLLRKGDPGAGAEIRLAPASAGGDPRPDAEPVLVTRAANVPNPFHPQTAIRYRLAGPARVTVHVFDYRGRLVRTLVGGEEQQAGPQQVFWDGRDDGGHRASSGVYFYRILAGTGTVARKMVLLP